MGVEPGRVMGIEISTQKGTGVQFRCANTYVFLPDSRLLQPQRNCQCGRGVEEIQHQ